MTMHLYEKVAFLRNGGMNVDRISARLEIPIGRIRSAEQHAKRKGLIESVDLWRKAVYRRSGLNFGTMTTVIQSLSPECREWLVDQCSGDMKLADAVSAIVTDAYLDDQARAEKKGG